MICVKARAILLRANCYKNEREGCAGEGSFNHGLDFSGRAIQRRTIILKDYTKRIRLILLVNDRCALPQVCSAERSK